MICIINTHRATLPLTDSNKDKAECTCSIASHNNGSGVNNATNVATDLHNIDDYCSGVNENCRAYNNGLNQNGSNANNRNGDAAGENPLDESRRHNSMDRLMGLLNDMGSTQRTRSLSDGGREEGEFIDFGFISLFHPLIHVCLCSVLLQ